MYVVADPRIHLIDGPERESRGRSPLSSTSPSIWRTGESMENEVAVKLLEGMQIRRYFRGSGRRPLAPLVYGTSSLHGGQAAAATHARCYVAAACLSEDT